MMIKYFSIFMALTAMNVTAAVTLDGTNNNDGSNIVWTISDLNGAPPTITGDNTPTADGTFSGIGTLDAIAQFTMNISSVINYDSVAATGAITGGSFGSYMAGLTTGLVNGVQTSFGINSGPGDSNINFISDDEALIIELVDTTNLTKEITLEGLGWANETINDRADILIYHAASNSVTEVQWNERPSAYTGSYPLGVGDIIVIGNRADLYRLETITVDIAPAATLTNVLPVAGLTAVSDNALVQLDWAADNTGFLDSYNVYRTTTMGSNYLPLATGVTTNSYADTNVVNEISYYYAVTALGADAYETELSDEVSATPTAALIIENLTNSLQGDARANEDPATSTYQTNGSAVIFSALKAGEYGVVAGGSFTLARPIIKFPLSLADLGEKTTNDIRRVLLKMYLNQNTLMEAPEGTQVDVYASQSEAANTAIVAGDFESLSYSNITTWAAISTNTPEMAFYEVDVTAMVLADLGNDIQDATAGVCFRLQLTDDTSLSSTNNPFGGLVSVRFDDNSQANPPQLRIEFKSGLTPYEEWGAGWGGKIGESAEDFDHDGLSNLYEYGLDGDPTNGSMAPAVLPTFGPASGGGYEYIHVQRSDDDSLIYTVETRTDLLNGSWTNTGYVVSGTNAMNGSLDVVTNTFDTDVENHKFIRLKIESK